MKLRFISIFVFLGFLFSGEIARVDKALKLFYLTDNHCAFELEKQHLLNLMKFRGMNFSRGTTETLLPVAISRGDVKIMEFLRRIDGENYRIYFEEGKIFLRKGKIIKALSLFWISYKKYVNQGRGLVKAIYIYTRVIPLSFLIFLLFLSLALFAWYYPLLFHDLKETAGGRVKGLFLFIAALLFPFVLLSGPGYIVFYIPALFSLYLEEGFSKRLLILTLIFALVSVVIPKREIVKKNPEASIMEKLYYYGEDAENLREAEKYLQKDWDEDVAYFLALSYEKLGKLKKTVSIYNRILKRNRNHVRSLVALANIRFKSGEIQNSIDLLRRAINVSGSKLIPLHDLSYIFENMGRVNESSKFSTEGWKLYGRKWDEFSKTNPDFVIYGWGIRDIFWKFFGRGVTSLNSAPRGLATIYAFSKPVLISPLILGFLLMLFVFYLKEKFPSNLGSAIYCQGCEKPICERCSHYYYKGYCNECMGRIELLKGNAGDTSSVIMGNIKKKRLRRLPREIVLSILDFLYPGSSLFPKGKIYTPLFSMLYVYSLSIFFFGLKIGFPLSLHFLFLAFLFYVLSVVYIYIVERRS